MLDGLMEKNLNDEEMISYYQNLINENGKDGILNGYFLKGIALVSSMEEFTFSYQTKRTFVNRVSSTVNPGYPLDSMQIEPTFEKFVSELTEEEKKATKSGEEQEVFEFLLQAISKIEVQNQDMFSR